MLLVRVVVKLEQKNTSIIVTSEKNFVVGLVMNVIQELENLETLLLELGWQKVTY